MNIRASAYVLVCASMVACGGGSNGSTAPVVPATPTTVAGAILAAEATQKTPSLNRDGSLGGPDSDGNGVRDDIDAYISSLSDTPDQKSALRQKSAVLTKTLTVDITNQSALLEVSRQIGAAAACNHARYEPGIAGKKGAEIEKFTINTKPRFDAYMAFSKALGGTTFVLPQGDGCVN